MQSHIQSADLYFAELPIRRFGGSITDVVGAPEGPAHRCVHPDEVLGLARKEALAPRTLGQLFRFRSAGGIRAVANEIEWNIHLADPFERFLKSVSVASRLLAIAEDNDTFSSLLALDISGSPDHRPIKIGASSVRGQADLFLASA